MSLLRRLFYAKHKFFGGGEMPNGFSLHGAERVGPREYNFAPLTWTQAEVDAAVRAALAADRERLAAEVEAGPPWQPAEAVAALIRKEPTT